MCFSRAELVCGFQMKIFVVGTRGFPDIQGGVEKHCEGLYPRLVKLGCQVTVAVRIPYVSFEKKITSWQGVKFIYLWCPRLKSLEAFIHTFLGVIWARFYSPDVLHVHAIGPALLVPLAKLLGLKVVFTHHGPDHERHKWGRLAKLFLRLGEYCGVRFADQIIVISTTIKNQVIEKFGRRDIAVIPNGVSIPDKVPAGETLKKWGLSPKKYVFIACRFVPEKGLHDLISAYQKISNPEFKLVIAGDADHETEYSRSLKKQAKETGVVSTGFLSGKPLAELYSNAGLFVLPSYYEGLPIALLEALSYDLPVLVSDIPANREIPLVDSKYFHNGNIPELTSKMDSLYQRGLLDSEITEQRNVLLKFFDWDSIAEKTREVYLGQVSC